MSDPPHYPENQSAVRDLPRNVWATSVTSFLMDISSEMVINILPLFLANVIGVKTGIIGLIEGVAEATASLLKVFSGWFSDRLRARKWLAVAGYGISALVKPFYYFANSWGLVAGVRWVDRVGKGVRTAPRDALIADSIQKEQRGLAYGFHRAADTAGAMLGLLIALGVVWWTQTNAAQLSEYTFRAIVLISLVPAVLAVLTLAFGAKDVPITSPVSRPRFAITSLGKPFVGFLVIVGVFELGNSSDAFPLLLAQNRGMSVSGILGMLVVFNLVYTLVSMPAGRLSDRIGRRWLIFGGWLLYGVIYLGFGLSQTASQVGLLYIAYGLYYGLVYGTAKALVADLVPETVRGTAFGTYNAILGILDFPASLIAGLLWQSIGASAPFIFSAVAAFIAALMLLFWMPGLMRQSSQAA